MSLFKVLEQMGHDVEIVTFKQNTNQLLWYRIFVEDRLCKSIIKKTQLFNGQSYSALARPPTEPIAHGLQFLGEGTLSGYDCCIFSNPWLLSTKVYLDTKQVICICHDVVANKYAFQRMGLKNISLLKWGFAHNSGYTFLKEIDAYFLSNSSKTDEEMSRFYGVNRHSYLPPVLPYPFFDLKTGAFKKEKAAILAAPFDPRKGFESMPAFLNALKEDLDVLYIFGRPRCQENLYKKFWKDLKVKKKIYFYEITSHDLIELYKKCKILIFPSIEEGLGIPLLEAQACGCRVVTTNAKPMNELALSGHYLLTGNFEKDILFAREMLRDESFDYESLSKEASRRFSPNHVASHLASIIGKD